jgi:hypothetical protein
VREGKHLNVPTALCQKLLDMIHELQSGKRKLGMENYTELAGTTKP